MRVSLLTARMSSVGKVAASGGGHGRRKAKPMSSPRSDDEDCPLVAMRSTSSEEDENPWFRPCASADVRMAKYPPGILRLNKIVQIYGAWLYKTSTDAKARMQMLTTRMGKSVIYALEKSVGKKQATKRGKKSVEVPLEDLGENLVVDTTAVKLQVTESEGGEDAVPDGEGKEDGGAKPKKTQSGKTDLTWLHDLVLAVTSVTNNIATDVSEDQILGLTGILFSVSIEFAFTATIDFLEKKFTMWSKLRTEIREVAAKRLESKAAFDSFDEDSGTHSVNDVAGLLLKAMHKVHSTKNM